MVSAQNKGGIAAPPQQQAQPFFEVYKKKQLLGEGAFGKAYTVKDMTGAWRHLENKWIHQRQSLSSNEKKKMYFFAL